MLDVLPAEVSLEVLRYLPIPSLCSLSILSHQWYDFLSTNQPAIFYSAAILHGYIQPGSFQVEDALAQYTGSPGEGSTDWKDFCRRFFQLGINWEGKGRAVARLLSPPGNDVHRFKVDEKAGICIATHMFGGLSVNHLFSSILLWCLPPIHVRPNAHCEYDNGYLVFDCLDGQREVWRLASDFDAGEVAAFAPPDEEQREISALCATRYRQYAPRGHFRPWAKLFFPQPTYAFRLAYPTLVCASHSHACLHDVRTGSLVQTIDIHLETINYVDVNERHVFVCEPTAVHVYLRAGGTEALRIPNNIAVVRVESPNIIPGDPFVTPLSLSPDLEDSFPDFIAAHVSRDGRDLVVLGSRHRVLLVRDFERICRGETTLQASGYALRIQPRDVCCYLGFEHGRFCVATHHGLYIFTPDSGPSVKAVFVRPYSSSAAAHNISCMQLTDRRVYFTWEDARRRDIRLFEDEGSAPELSPPTTPPVDEAMHEALGPLWPGEWEPPEGISVGCIDFSLMPEN